MTSKVIAWAATAVATTFLIACSSKMDLLKKDEGTKSGYVSYPSQYAPSVAECNHDGKNGPVSVASIEKALKDGWPDDAKILATVMNGDAPTPMLEFAQKCLGYEA